VKQGSTLYTDSQSKANILFLEFQSVFTMEEKSSIFQLNGLKYQEAPPVTICTDGVLLKNIKLEKASGVSRDWADAASSPIFKKGNVHLASNYRPVHSRAHSPK
jgi:hypothetical protein